MCLFLCCSNVVTIVATRTTAHTRSFESVSLDGSVGFNVGFSQKNDWTSVGTFDVPAVLATSNIGFLQLETG